MNPARTNPITIFAPECNEFFALAAFGRTESLSFAEAFEALLAYEPRVNDPAKSKKSHARPLRCGKYSARY